MSTLDNESSGGGNLASYGYQYDAAGNVMEVTETYATGGLSNRTITNSYDGVYRLLTEAITTTGGGTVTTTYVYDKGHNRTSKAVSGGTTTTYVIGNGGNGAGANQIVSETTGGVTTAYGYDANGNRSTRSVGGNADTYTYDDENRLINLDYQTGESGTGTYVYAYDYRTRRVARTEPGPVATNIVFDGGTSIIEYGAAGAPSPNVEYVRGHDYGGGVGGLEYSVRSGAARFNFYDSRGDVTTQTDVAGAIAFQTAYEAFGNQTVTSGSTEDRQKASTKEEDPTGLLNEGFRYRDPDTGTFLSRDPLGFKAGPNMYTYVHQNPWTHFDPEGLDGTQPNPPPPPPPPTKKDGSNKSTANNPSPPVPSAQLDIPKLSLNMQSPTDQALGAAADFDRAASTSKSTSASTTSAKSDKGESQSFVEFISKGLDIGGDASAVGEFSSAGHWTVGSNFNLDNFKLKLSTGGWGGNQYMSMLKLGEIAHYGGLGMTAVSGLMDVHEYEKNKIGGPHLSANLGMGGIAIFGGLPGAVAAGTYGAIDKYYPAKNEKEGGFVNFVRDVGNSVGQTYGANPEFAVPYGMGVRLQ